MASYYYKRKVKPYLKFNSVVECDETFLGGNNFRILTKHPQSRWLFGLFDRASKITIMKYLKEKNTNQILPFLKAHMPPGVILISDMHSIYVKLGQNKSRLTQFGWYHMWANHSEMFIHNKYPFVHSMGIERRWGDLKRFYTTMNSC